MHGNNERDEMDENLKSPDSPRPLAESLPLKYVVPAPAGRSVPGRPPRREKPHRPCFVRLEAGTTCNRSPAVGTASMSAREFKTSDPRLHLPLAFIFASFP